MASAPGCANCCHGAGHHDPQLGCLYGNGTMYPCECLRYTPAKLAGGWDEFSTTGSMSAVLGCVFFASLTITLVSKVIIVFFT